MLILPCFLKLEPDDSEDANAESGLSGLSEGKMGSDGNSLGVINGTVLIFLSLFLCFLALFFFLGVSTSIFASSINEDRGAGSGRISPVNIRKKGRCIKNHTFIQLCFQFAEILEQSE